MITLKWHNDSKWNDKWRMENLSDKRDIDSLHNNNSPIKRVGDYQVRDASVTEEKEKSPSNQDHQDDWKQRLSDWFSITGFYFFLFASAYFVISIFIYGFILSFLLLFS